MPTENRSSNTEMVCVPPYIGLEPLVGRYYPALCRRCGWVGSSEELTEDDAQCTRDAGDRLCLGDCDELGRDDLLGIIQAMAKAAQQHHGEPVVLPKYRRDRKHNSHDWDEGHMEGWSECFEEFTKPGPLYTHPAPADTAEVERLRSIERVHDLRDALLQQVKGERDRMIDRTCESSNQLDKAHALLRLISEQPLLNPINRARIKTLLSDSAEPSAPEGHCEAWGKAGNRCLCPACCNHRRSVTEPSAQVEIDDQPEFVKTITAKLQRFLGCAEDGQGADIGREWFDVLTKLGLLQRIQRSPAW